VPEYFKERINPIRRLFMYPLDTVFKPLEGVLVSMEVENIRTIVCHSLGTKMVDLRKGQSPEGI
jgi:hypothetical protein